MAAKRKPASVKQTAALRAPDVNKKEVLDLMLNGVKVFLTTEGREHLWGTQDREKTPEGGMKIKFHSGTQEAG